MGKSSRRLMVVFTIVAILGALWFARHGLCVRGYPSGIVDYEASEREGRLVLELAGYEYSDRCTGAFVGHDLWCTSPIIFWT